jgi:hypothetical protein
MSFLTPTQFKKTAAGQKPGASYNGYRNWVTKTRRARASAQTSNPLGSLLQTFQGSLLNPAQQAAQARQQVQQQITASLAGIRASTKAEQAQANRQAARAQSYAAALGNLTKNDPAQIAAQYRASADRMSGYETGLTGAALEAQKADSAQVADRMKNLGIEKAPGSYDLNSLRNTALTLGNVIPGENTENEAARAFATAEYARQGGIHQIGDIAQQYLAKTTDAQAQLASQRATLEGQRPGLYAKAISDAQQEQRQNMATLITALTLQGTQANQQSLIGSRSTGGRVAVAKVTGVDPKTGKILPGFWRNPSHKNAAEKIPAGMTVSADGGRLVALPSRGGGSKGPKKMTPAQIQTMIGKNAKDAMSAVRKPPYSQVDPIFPDDPPKPLLPYGEAKRKVLQAYFPKAYWTNAQVLAKVNDILASAGYKMPSTTTKPATIRGSHGAAP